MSIAYDADASPTARSVGYRKTAISGAVVTGAGTLAKATLQVLAIVWLARLLSPSDFGITAMVFPLIAFATIFQEAGLGLAVLQRQNITNEELSTVFWTNAAIGAVMGGLLVLVSPLIAAFYSEPRVAALTAASGALVFLGGLSSQHIALLNREMAFNKLALMDVLSLTIGTALALSVAFLFGSYWAIFLLSFGTTASMCAVAWLLSGWRPGRRAPLRQVVDVLKFGGNITLSNLATYFGRNLDKILIGRAWGTVALGFYERAYKVVLLPILFVHMPLFRLAVPMLSQSRTDPLRYRRIFILAYQLSLLIAVPGTVLLIAGTSEIVRIVLGNQWVSGAPIFAWLAVATLGQLATGPLTMIFVSQDRSREAMISSVVSSLYSSIAFAIGLPWGAVGVAIAFAASELIRTPIVLWYATRSGPVTFRDLSTALLPFGVAAIAAMIGVRWLGAGLAGSHDVLFLAAVGAGAYAITLVCLLMNQVSRDFLLELAQGAKALIRRQRLAEVASAGRS